MNTPTLDEVITQNVALALAEDLGNGDLTATLIAAATVTRASVQCREPAVLCGRAWFDQVFRQIDPQVSVLWRFEDGDSIAADSTVCELMGPARALVSGERTALNFLQTLSGTATTTRQYVEALNSRTTRILDTRKTIPGLRHAQKYAVRCGGGQNHRMGLFDAVLIKENHIAAAGSIGAAVKAMRQQHGDVSIEVEVETAAELNQAIQAGADIVLLDNFSVSATKDAVKRVDGQLKTEISGGVELDRLAALGELGADYISVGALTKHLRAIDFSMRLHG